MRESQFRIRNAWTVLPIFMFLLWLNPANAQGDLVRMGGGAENSMIVPLYKSRIVSLNAPANRISVGNPDIADIVIVQSNQLYVLGKDLGTTNILLWDRGDNLIGTLNIEVTHDLQSLKEKLYRLLPKDRIEVYSAQRNIVLSGQVSNIGNMNAALRIAQGYFVQLASATESETFELEQSASTRDDKSVGEIINLMSVGGVHQVMLEVKVAEVKRTEIKSLDVNFAALVTDAGNWDWGAFNGGADAPNPANNKGFFGSFVSNSAQFNIQFEALKQNGLAKILAEPTLVTMSGHEAKFVSGGEFGFQVAGNLGANTVEFKEFGILIGFLPIVLDSGQISLKLDITVSELSGVEVLGIPSLVKRGAQSTVELGDGQTIGIAGLIDEDLVEQVSKFPGLGSIPILGTLFRSQEFRKRETELLIMVTPHLAKPLIPAEIQLPTDNLVEPSDFGWYLNGELRGRATAEGGSKVGPRRLDSATE
jgi:pilus assembly protein CpaC